MIRREKELDIEKIWRVNAAAFESQAEANLVNILRDSAVPFISLVAEEHDEIVGHILFTPVILVAADPALRLLGLGPMAVAPDFQGRGIGSQLVRAGLKACRESGYDAVVVLGHPWFYPKFGFIPASRFGIKSEYDVPDEVFMVIELKKGVLEGKSGVIKYHPAFSRV